MEPKKEHKCLRCGYTWRSAKDKPAACPYCKSYKWNLKKEEEGNGKEGGRPKGTSLVIRCAVCGEGIKNTLINKAMCGDDNTIVIIGPDVYHKNCYDLK